MALNYEHLQGRVGVLRIVSLVAGFLVFLTVFGQQIFAIMWYYDPDPTVFHKPMTTDVPWFGLFGYVITLLYLCQATWFGLLIFNVISGSSAEVVQKIDGGVNGLVGYVIGFLCVWWLVLLIYTFFYSDKICPRVAAFDVKCLERTMIGFACASWVFAAVQGITSILLGLCVSKNIKNNNRNILAALLQLEMPPSSPPPAHNPLDKNTPSSTA